MTFITTIVAFIAVLPLLLIEQGWAISTLWGWFLVPLGAPEIGISTAIGVSLVTAVIRMKGKRNEPERTRKQSTEFLIGLFLYPLTTVGIGWIVKQFL